eukprot:augustus_masked-scaffold_14-processed-gene-8.43-mRNA-1 protein AED:1.00 eAED:1.00 QI:0/-1/0/0/-1/1/1/0/422
MGQTPSTECVALWDQCGGLDYTGPTDCCDTAGCYQLDEYFSQCQLQADPNFNPVEECETFVSESTTIEKRFGPSVHGKLSVSGNRLVDQFGDPVQLKGVSSHGLQYFHDCYREESLKMLVDSWNINLFRIAFYVAEEERGYSVNKTLYGDLIRLSSLCVDLDIYCLIDWHVLEHGDPLYYLTGEGAEQANILDFWLQVSTDLLGFDNFLFELINEPNYGDLSFARTDEAWAALKRLAGSLIPAIREIDPDRVLILGTPSWDQELRYPYEDPLDISLVHNLMYTFHFYAGTHDYLLESFDLYTDVLPVFVTEYGLSDATGGGGIFLDTAQQYLDIVNSKKLGSSAWSFSENDESSGMLLPGSCYQATFDTLTCGGVFIKNMLTTDNFILDSLQAEEVDEFTSGASLELSNLFLLSLVNFLAFR